MRKVGAKTATGDDPRRAGDCRVMSDDAVDVVAKDVVEAVVDVVVSAEAPGKAERGSLAGGSEPGGERQRDSFTSGLLLSPC